MKSRWYIVRMVVLAVVLALGARGARAHPMPNSLVLLTVHSQRLDAELHLPLGELQPAFGHPLADSPRAVLPRYDLALRQYLARHVRVQSPDGRYWALQTGRLYVQHQQNELTGPYDEVVAALHLAPPPRGPTCATSCCATTPCCTRW